ncbi:uncharacterized protein [Rhodnius prolixus]|uniref:uncharacterized protein n=1 Tax=Rhodnius prolixus TaxID=13249 RepID=UPI003D18B21D
MEGLEDLSKVCRLCLQSGEVMCPIFASGRHNNGTTALPYRIMSCARVKLVEGDGLPSNVCTNCLAQVDRSYQFKLLCERSDLTLRGGLKADSSTDSESLDGGESWDMTKFTPEVIIKEEADEGTLLENGLPNPSQSLESYLAHLHHHHNHSHHSFYPFTHMEEILRNHGTEIKVQTEHLPSSNPITNGNPAVPVTLGGQPTALLVAHRLVPVLGHQQGGASPGGPAATTAVLVATTAPPPPAHQQQQHVPSQQHHQTSSQAKVTFLATTVPVANATPPPLPSSQLQQQQQKQQPQHNGTPLQNNLHQKQKHQHHQQNEMLHHHGTLDTGSLSSKSRRCRGGDKLFKCSQCNKSYSFSSALSRHKAVHNKELRPHICKICNKGFTHPDKLLRHQKTHTMDVFINCEVCNKPFKSYPAYQKHKQSNNCEGAPSGNDSGGNWCETCNVELNRDETHVCNGGENIAASEDNNSKQITGSGENSPNREQPTETEEDPGESPPPPSPPPNARRTKGKSDFKCKVCLKYFATKGSLEVHSTIHTGVRPFVCSACGKSFRHKVNLMEHFQRKHSQVRPYICDVCAARFVTKQELVRHYRKHIGD